MAGGGEVGRGWHLQGRAVGAAVRDSRLAEGQMKVMNDVVGQSGEAGGVVPSVGRRSRAAERWGTSRPVPARRTRAPCSMINLLEKKWS